MKKPWFSMVSLGLILLLCIFAEGIMTYDPSYLDLNHTSEAPGGAFYFGTDPLGRDVFSMIWYGGRISLFIGLAAAAISTLIALVYGSLSGTAPEWIDDGMMRFVEILLSVPSILILIFLQAVIGQTSPISIAAVIGLTGWMNIAKVVRSEVRQLKNGEFIIAARCMGGGFLYILRWHLLPNLVPAIMFMVVTNVSMAIGTESTLSFLGIGLPVEVISWGSMLSLADQVMMGNEWWVIVIPGLFLAWTLVCITDIGNYIRGRGLQEKGNL